jgi:cytosine/adenosine deaminase-related metal-dependent hydrolase
VIPEHPESDEGDDVRIGRGRIAVLAAGAVATAGIAGGAVAATSGGGDEASDLAAAINERAGTQITADDVEGAYLDLLEERLDEAVTAGRLTREQADEMLARAKDAPGLPGLGGHGGPGMSRGGGPHGAVLDEVATKLKLTEAQIRQRLENGSTLTKIAKAQGVSRAELITTIRAALKADGVPAARTAELAAHIADDTRPEPGEHRRGPRP